MMTRISQEIVRLIITMNHGLHMQVVAEGTKTVKQIGVLQRLRCEMPQDYLFARPASRGRDYQYFAKPPGGCFR